MVKQCVRRTHGRQVDSNAATNRLNVFYRERKILLYLYLMQNLHEGQKICCLTKLIQLFLNSLFVMLLKGDVVVTSSVKSGETIDCMITVGGVTVMSPIGLWTDVYISCTV